MSTPELSPSLRQDEFIHEFSSDFRLRKENLKIFLEGRVLGLDARHLKVSGVVAAGPEDVDTLYETAKILWGRVSEVELSLTLREILKRSPIMFYKVLPLSPEGPSPEEAILSAFLKSRPRAPHSLPPLKARLALAAEDLLGPGPLPPFRTLRILMPHLLFTAVPRVLLPPPRKWFSGSAGESFNLGALNDSFEDAPCWEHLLLFLVLGGQEEPLKSFKVTPESEEAYLKALLAGAGVSDFHLLKSLPLSERVLEALGSQTLASLETLAEACQFSSYEEVTFFQVETHLREEGKNLVASSARLLGKILELLADVLTQDAMSAVTRHFVSRSNSSPFTIFEALVEESERGPLKMATKEAFVTLLESYDYPSRVLAVATSKEAESFFMEKVICEIYPLEEALKLLITGVYSIDAPLRVEELLEFSARREELSPLPLSWWRPLLSCNAGPPGPPP